MPQNQINKVSRAGGTWTCERYDTTAIGEQNRIDKYTQQVKDVQPREDLLRSFNQLRGHVLAITKIFNARNPDAVSEDVLDLVTVLGFTLSGKDYEDQAVVLTAKIQIFGKQEPTVLNVTTPVLYLHPDGDQPQLYPYIGQLDIALQDCLAAAEDFFINGKSAQLDLFQADMGLRNEGDHGALTDEERAKVVQMPRVAASA